GVTIDKDDNISLNGRGGVLVLINDRDPHLGGQNLANYLRGMPGNNIEKIEVMNNPSSKYDAEGTGGIINIKTVRSQASGFSGSVNAGVGYDKLFDGNGGFDLNYRHEKFTVYANASVYQWKNVNYIYSRTDYADGSRLETNGAGNERKTPVALTHGFSIFGEGGIDYYPTKQDVLSLSYNGDSYSGRNTFDNCFSRFHPQADSNSVLYSFGQKAKTSWSGQSHDANLNYEHTFDTVFNRKLTLNFDYLRNLSFNDGTITASYFSGDFAHSLYNDTYYSAQPFTSNIYTFKADYEHPFSDRTTLEAGLKFSYVDNDTRNTYRDTLGTLLDYFLYDEMIGAAYIMVNHTFKTKTSLQVGLRAEYTHTKGNNVSMDSVPRRAYIRPFPNITI
ncbi:MAG: outer membrane beta-barrel protein, partial [Bacteroidales bacterium]|nr:outer membrane beta-barrel protein [Bacteroidales bacterium]